jgi:hypothetical protein
MKRWTIARSVGAAGLLVAVPLLAQTMVQAQDRRPAGTMEETRKDDGRKAQLTEPGAEHKKLDPFVGSWEFSGQCWGKAGDTPESVSGTDDTEWVLGNRFLKCHTKATKGGKPFEGMGMLGYDNSQRMFQSSW